MFAVISFIDPKYTAPDWITSLNQSTSFCTISDNAVNECYFYISFFRLSVLVLYDAACCYVVAILLSYSGMSHFLFMLWNSLNEVYSRNKSYYSIILVASIFGACQCPFPTTSYCFASPKFQTQHFMLSLGL